MWSDAQLNAAEYVTHKDHESQQDLNSGTIEVKSGSGQGVFLMRPAPPFGGLGTDTNSVAGLKYGATFPIGKVSSEYVPRGRPVPTRTVNDQFVIHDFGKPNL